MNLAALLRSSSTTGKKTGRRCRRRRRRRRRRRFCRFCRRRRCHRCRRYWMNFNFWGKKLLKTFL